jgi:hypothetical protein
MDDQELAKTKALATAMRTAIEKARASFPSGASTLRYFPHRCCHSATRLLVLYFHENGLSGFTEVTADLYKSGLSNDEEERHVWLEKGGVVVDITADQFDTANEKVIVTRASDWHSSMIIESREQPGVEGEDDASFCKRLLEYGFYKLAYETVHPFLE